MTAVNTADTERLAWLAVNRARAAQHPGELAQMAEHLRGRPLGRVLEIGVYKGGTFWFWRQLGARTIVGIDIGIVCAGCDWRRAHDDCPYDRIAENGILLEGDSRSLTVKRQAQRLLGGPVDLLHIDGDHSYETARSDYELYAPLVRSGGTIIVHDVVSYDDVARMWADCCADKLDAFVIHEPATATAPAGMGIGVLPVL